MMSGMVTSLTCCRFHRPWNCVPAYYLPTLCFDQSCYPSFIFKYRSSWPYLLEVKRGGAGLCMFRSRHLGDDIGKAVDPRYIEDCVLKTQIVHRLCFCRYFVCPRIVFHQGLSTSLLADGSMMLMPVVLSCATSGSSQYKHCKQRTDLRGLALQARARPTIPYDPTCLGDCFYILD